MAEPPDITRGQRGALAATAATLVLTFAYAAVRYVYFGPILAIHMPLYVLNKAFAWSGTALLAAALAVGPLARLHPAWQGLLRYRRSLGLYGVVLATLHLLVSLPILNMFYYTHFFQIDGTLKATSELSFLAGSLGLLLLAIVGVTSLPGIRQAMPEQRWRHWQGMANWALVLTFAHSAWLGWNGWWRPDQWYGSLPPITLLSCLMILPVGVLRIITVSKRMGKAPG